MKFLELRKKWANGEKVVQVPWRVPKWHDPWEAIEAAIDIASLLSKLTQKERDCVAAYNLGQGEVPDIAHKYRIQIKSVQKVSERAVKKLQSLVVKIS